MANKITQKKFTKIFEDYFIGSGCPAPGLFKIQNLHQPVQWPNQNFLFESL